LTGAAAIIEAAEKRKPFKKVRENYRIDYTTQALAFYVREPFISRASQATMVAGVIRKDMPLIVTSQMPSGGVIFSDGIEKDFLAFDSGTTATICVADRHLALVVRA
jgi:hypothetical protein